MPTDRSDAASTCDHQRCQENGHCILDALWLNAPEFENPVPIQAAAAVQERFWKERHAYKLREKAVAESLWILVDAGGMPT